IQPLALRARAGECLVLTFTNRLDDGEAALPVHGLAHTGADHGGAVGENPASYVPPGGSITTRIAIPADPSAEGAYYFHDHGDSRQRVAHGLFGAVIVEPAGATWRDPETGEPSDGTNWEAIIQVPGEPDFREFVLFYHEVGDEDFTGIVDAAGAELPQVDDLSGVYRPAGRALNYRSEPFMRRLEIEPDKSHGYGSYMFGDPATPIPRSYLKEPTKTRLLHGGSEVFHVHHLHGGGDRWRRNPDADPNHTIAGGLDKKPADELFSVQLDSQTIGPGNAYDLEHECGAGGCQQAAGDFLYHCHIGHHYVAGMWSFWRVFDTEQPDLATLPDMAPPPVGVPSTGLVGL
ncbi:MAG: multicopper oxidase domain-containing protein, partial [Myxococcota bacterium]